MSVEIRGIDSINRLIRPVASNFGASEEHLREFVSARQGKFRNSNVGYTVGRTANARAVAVIDARPSSDHVCRELIRVPFGDEP